MKLELFFLLLFYSIPNQAQIDLKSIDSIVFYDFDGVIKSEFGSIVNSKGDLNRKIVRKSFKLNKLKFKEFNTRLNLKSSYGKGTASCYEPHLGIVYYSKGKPKYYINICFSCNILRANFKIPNQNQGKTGEEKDIYYISAGMSKTYRLYLNNLIAIHNFSNQIDKKSMFDK